MCSFGRVWLSASLTWMQVVGGKGGGLSISEIWLQIIMLPWNVPQPNKSHGFGYTERHYTAQQLTPRADQRSDLWASLRSTAEIPLSFREARLSSSVFKGITYKILNWCNFSLTPEKWYKQNSKVLKCVLTHCSPNAAPQEETEMAPLPPSFFCFA